ncbi:hypothetical protein [Schinkia azotoformans]|uniref:hypothetical protein n=1 Tax=Schinkia azotoformans TaxID=1454 RepID=UPI002DB796F1|nr:hypothetical protein [Schinkia azotoformans]MEC1778425.1 hypothetical protein [Schinkia azotoformans]MED4328330.1 hypothetical protein [Schinkia azotoformans]
MFVVRGLDGTIFESCDIRNQGKEQTFNSKSDAQLFINNLKFCMPFLQVEIIEI